MIDIEIQQIEDRIDQALKIIKFVDGKIGEVEKLMEHFVSGRVEAQEILDELLERKEKILNG